MGIIISISIVIRLYFMGECEMVTVIASLITGLLALAGVIVTNSASNKEIEHKLETAQAVTDTKLEALKEEVQKHNNFASEIPVLKNRVSVLEDSVKELKQK